MQKHAFDVLGIEPTTDARTIRDAFVRLARIYHPDRFTGISEDVRAEAERRMKDVTVAYETLLAAKRTAVAAAAGAGDATRRKHDPWEEARRARQVIAHRRAEQERSRARWLLWEELERRARERATLEARLADLATNDLSRAARESGPPAELDLDQATRSLARRLEEARAGTPTSLRKTS